MKISKLFHDFLESEKAGGLTLIFCTALSLILANTWGGNYVHMWHFQMAGHSLEHWINDGLMAVFFLLIGLELKREMYTGELSNVKQALLPLVGALGGMLIPAGLYLLLNSGTPTQSGFGIPMATDIAFAIGILSLLGKRVPLSLKVFLTALAVIDDLGAILIIAVFYTKALIWSHLLISLSVFGLLLVLNKLQVKSLIPYLIGGVFMWYFMLNSGVHATISGVLLAFAVPFGGGKSASSLLQHALHKPVAFLILPLFALANTAIIINNGWENALMQTYTLGIALGLILGKPAGIFLFSYLPVKLGLCKLPGNVNWKALLGIGFLGGIGFTMSIFIALLAFSDQSQIDNAKAMILLASCLAGLLGFILLKTIGLKKT